MRRFPSSLAVALQLCSLGYGQNPAQPQLQDARRFLGLAESAAAKIEKPYEKNAALTEIGVLLAKAHDSDGARRLAKVVDRPGAVLAAAATDIALAGDDAAAREIAGGIQDVGWRFSTVYAISAALMRAGRVEDGEKLLRNDTAIQGELSKWSQYDERLPGYDLNVVLFLVRKTVKEGVIDVATVHDLYEMARGMHEYSHYGALAGFKALAGDRKGADQWMEYFLHEIAQEENSAMVTGTAQGLIWAGDMDDAIRLGDAAKEEASKQGVYLSAAYSSADKGDFAGAAKLLEKITATPYRAVALAAVGNAMAAQKNPQALATLKSAEETESKVRDTQFKIWATVAVVEGYAALGDLESARGGMVKLEGFTKRQHSEDTEEELARLYLLVGDVAAATRWAGKDERILASIASHQASHGDLNGARQTSARLHGVIEAPERPLDFVVRQAIKIEAGSLPPSEIERWALTLGDVETRVWALVGLAEGSLDKVAGTPTKPTTAGALPF